MPYRCRLFAISLMLLLVPRAVFGSRPGVKLEDKAVSVGQGQKLTTGGVLFSDLSMAAPRVTDPARVEGVRVIKMSWNLTRNGTATEVKMGCEESDDMTTWRNIPFVNNNNPPNTVTSPRVWKETVAGNAGTSWVVPGVAHIFVRCTFTTTPADASDLLTVTGRLGDI